MIEIHSGELYPVAVGLFGQRWNLALIASESTKRPASASVMPSAMAASFRHHFGEAVVDVAERQSGHQ